MWFVSLTYFSLKHFAHHGQVAIFNKHWQKPLRVPGLRAKWKHNSLSLFLWRTKPLDVKNWNKNLTCVQRYCNSLAVFLCIKYRKVTVIYVVSSKFKPVCLVFEIQLFNSWMLTSASCIASWWRHCMKRITVPTALLGCNDFACFWGSKREISLHTAGTAFHTPLWNDSNTKGEI